MAYARELDEIKQELRKSVAGTIRFWPKYQGANCQVKNTGCTYQVFDSAGTSIQAATAIDGTLVGDVDRFDMTVNAISTLQEDCRIDLLWIEATQTAAILECIYFDVVTYPWGDARISLNDLIEERADIPEILDRLGQRFGYTAGEAAQEGAAAIFARKAHVELDVMLRAQIGIDAQTNESASRPRLVLNRIALDHVARKLAMKSIYEHEQNQEQVEYWERQVDRSWASVGPLKYDTSEDKVADLTVLEIGRVVHQARTQS